MQGQTETIDRRSTTTDHVEMQSRSKFSETKPECKTEEAPLVPQHVINLGNPIKGLKHKYSHNIKFLPYLIFSFINLVFCYPNRVLYHITANEDVLQKVLLLYFGIILVICIVFSLYSYLCKSNASKGWRETSNRNLQVPKPTTLYEVRVTEYLPSIMIASLIWCCVINIVIVIVFPDAHISEICYDDDNRPAACFAVESFAGCYFTFATFGIFLMLQSITPKFKRILQAERNKIEDNYENITEIIKRVDQRLQEWIDSKKSENRKSEILITCVLAFAFTICEGGYPYGREDVQILDRDQNIWQSNYPVHVITIGIISIIGDWLIVCLIFPVCHVVTFYHFAFFWHIMDELSAPINAEDANDIAAWWELRKYYIHCVVNIYSSTFAVIIVAALTGAFIIAICGFFDILGPYLSLAGTMYCFLIVFVLMTQAVSYHTALLSHVVTLNKERLRFVMMENGNDNVATSKKTQIAERTINLIAIDIEKDSQPISTLGIGLNHAFMYALRASAVSIGAAMLVQFDFDLSNV